MGRVVKCTSSPGLRFTPSSTSPIRIFGPGRSISVETPPASSRASKTRLWVSRSPWERLILATSIPASAIALRVSGRSEEGPMVQTILALTNWWPPIRPRAEDLRSLLIKRLEAPETDPGCIKDIFSGDMVQTRRGRRRRENG